MRTTFPIAVACLAALAACEALVSDPERATAFSKINGDDQVVEVGEEVRLSVRLIDGHGRPIAGATVVWEVLSGAGRIELTAARTAADGVASAALLAGLGENRVRVRLEGSNLLTIFSVHGCAPCGTWRLLETSMVAARAWAGSAVLDGRIWVIGGIIAGADRRSTSTVAVDIFNPAAGTWSRGPQLPAALGALNAAATGATIYVMGGYLAEPVRSQGLKDVYAVDPSTSRWIARAELNIGRFFAAGAALNGKVYVAGGQSYCDIEGCYGGPYASLEVYEAVADRWINGPAMRESRAAAGAAVLDHKLYIIGGHRSDGLFLSDAVEAVERFDPVTNQWTSIAGPSPSGPVQVTAANGKLYVLATDQKLTRVFEYDAATNRWLRLKNFPVRVLGASVAAVAGRLYVIGGQNDDNPFFPQFSGDVYVLER